MVIGRVAQDLAAQVLVVDRRRHRADAPVPGDEGHVLGSAAKVPHDRKGLVALRIRDDQRDAQRRAGEVAGVVADPGQPLQAISIANDDERPLLGVLR
jgi:hypothetical protein